MSCHDTDTNKQNGQAVNNTTSLMSESKSSEPTRFNAVITTVADCTAATRHGRKSNNLQKNSLSGIQCFVGKMQYILCSELT